MQLKSPACSAFSSTKRLALVALALACFAGCVRVKPYQRETLARRDMTLGGNADLASGRDHAQAYREGSSGGSKVKSGGCGCN